MSTIEVKVPALGEFKDVPIIDVLVKPGDAVSKDDALVTLESEKATMDVPSPEAGTVRELKVKVGDRVSEGRVVLTLEAAGAGVESAAPRSEENRPAPAKDTAGAGRRDGPPAAAVAERAAPAPAPP
ncbi:MAG TPA: biotin/lipoyl-containing protein, partial [Anaeromyxobacter sp.]|nr:biotin/lipoyl-containing protein [Anaeromyxobacter sp.]